MFSGKMKDFGRTLWHKLLRNEYFSLLAWILKRIPIPFQRVNYLAYLIVGVLLCGGSGIWFMLISQTGSENNLAMIMALCSFATATMGTTFMDFLFFESSGEEEFLKGFSILSVAVVAVLSTIAVFRNVYSLALLAAIISFLLMWLKNGERFVKTGDVQKSDGGKVVPDAPISGTKEGYLL